MARYPGPKQASTGGVYFYGLAARAAGEPTAMSTRRRLVIVH